MRVSCPKCRQRFDVAHQAVLKEAQRLKDRAKTDRVPADDEAARQREDALRRRDR